MTTSILKVEGMSCEHCVQAVSGAVGALAGVAKVTVDLSGAQVTVEHDEAAVSVAQIKDEIEGQGFDVI